MSRPTSGAETRIFYQAPISHLDTFVALQGEGGLANKADSPRPIELAVVNQVTRTLAKNVQLVARIAGTAVIAGTLEAVGLTDILGGHSEQQECENLSSGLDLLQILHLN